MGLLALGGSVGLDRSVCTRMSKNPTDPEGEESIKVLGRAIYEFFIDGWLVMLAFGVAHASAKGVPAFGYWQSAFIGMVVAGLTTTGNLLVSSRIKTLGTMLTRK